MKFTNPRINALSSTSNLSLSQLSNYTQGKSNRMNMRIWANFKKMLPVTAVPIVFTLAYMVYAKRSVNNYILGADKRGGKILDIYT